MKPLTWRQIAGAIVLASVSTAGSAATMMANNSNKGSLLIWPRIDVRAALPVDTIVTLVNDGSTDVQVKCYYRSSEPVPTPLSSKVDVTRIKHTMDFTINLTRNQTIAWSAATGQQLGGALQVAPPFTSWPDGALRETGMLACWAIGPNTQGNITQINFNQLFGNASIVGAPFGVPGQAYEYNAWAFQALAGTAGQGQPVGNTPGVINLFTTLVTSNIVLNPSASNIGCVVPAGLPSAGLPCGPVGTAGAFTTDNAHLSFTGVLDIAAATGNTTFSECGTLKLLDFDQGAALLPAALTGLNRAQGGNYDIYASYTIAGTGAWFTPVNFLTTSVTSFNVVLYASPSSGTPMALNDPSCANNTPPALGVTFGSKDFILGTATIIQDPSNLGSVALGNNNTATTSLLALLGFTPTGGPSGPLTGATGFFQAPQPFQLTIGSQNGGNIFNTTWAPNGAGIRVQTLGQRGGGSLSFVAQVMSGYDSCPNILVGDFQAGPGALGRAGFATPAAPPVFTGGIASTTVSVVGCNQDFTQRARPFITKYTWTFWNEDEAARTGIHECGDGYYETYFPVTAGVGAAPNPGPFVGFPFAHFPALGTPTGYFRIESTADTAVCANAGNMGMLGVIAHANNGVFVRGDNLIGRGTTAGLITWDPGPPDSFKK